MYTEPYRNRTESEPCIQRDRTGSMTMDNFRQRLMTGPLPTNNIDEYRNRTDSMESEQSISRIRFANIDTYKHTGLESSPQDFYRNRLDSGISMEPFRNRLDSTELRPRLDSIGSEPYRSRLDSIGIEPLRNQISAMDMGRFQQRKTSNGDIVPLNIKREIGSYDGFKRSPSPSNSDEGAIGNQENTESIAHVLLSLDKTTKGNHSSDSHEKPHHSYIALISMAILSSPEKKMLLCDIYKYIMDSFQYYNNKEKAWRNSIRHNLSLNECFIKNGRSDNGKGNYWSIHPACVEDFGKGDFRRRQARRRARKSMKEIDSFDAAGVVAGRMNPLGYVGMTASPIGLQSYQQQPSTGSSLYVTQPTSGSFPSQTMPPTNGFSLQSCAHSDFVNTPEHAYIQLSHDQSYPTW